MWQDTQGLPRSKPDKVPALRGELGPAKGNGSLPSLCLVSKDTVIIGKKPNEQYYTRTTLFSLSLFAVSKEAIEKQFHKTNKNATY